MARLMRAHAIRAKTRRKSLPAAWRVKATTPSDPKLPVAENTSHAAGLVLNRTFIAHTPNKVWAGDITYVWTQEGVYLSRCFEISFLATSRACAQGRRMGALKTAVTGRLYSKPSIRRS